MERGGGAPNGRWANVPGMLPWLPDIGGNLDGGGGASCCLIGECENIGGGGCMGGIAEPDGGPANGGPR